MEERYIRFEHEEALDAKKELLMSQLNLIQLQKIINSYKNTKKKELQYRSKIKTSFSDLKTKLILIESTYPKDAIRPMPSIKKEKSTANQKNDYQKDLEEIKSKLERLNMNK
jgi:hypothetical protein